MTNIIEKFYTSFQQMDAESMSSCYHKDVIFEDPAFGVLNGVKASNMWKMLCHNSKDLNINYSNIIILNDKATAHWEAKYTFSQTGKKVHNIINASFELKDGKIIKHTDQFDLHQWAKQALGFKGLILGGTNFFKNKLQSQTNKLLSKFESTLQ